MAGGRPANVSWGPFVVVTLQPLATDLPNLIQRLRHIGIEDFGEIGPVEAFDEGTLLGLARLNVPELDRPLHTPCHQTIRNEFGAIVEQNRLQLTTLGGHLLQPRMTRSAGNQICTSKAKAETALDSAPLRSCEDQGLAGEHAYTLDCVSMMSLQGCIVALLNFRNHS